MLFLTAHDPEPEAKETVRAYFNQQIKLRNELNQGEFKNPVIEMAFVRFLHLLAHNPDFSMNDDDLQIFAVYVLPMSMLSLTG